MVISEKKSKLQIVIPEGYEIYKGKKPKTASQYGGKDAGWYVKRTPNALCIIVGWKISAEDAMDFDNPQNLIDGIHRGMSEKQGLIEVESGMTVRGYHYIYSIVKTVNDFQGTDYFLRMHVADGDDIIELHCEFSEEGMTGIRDSMCMELSRRAKLIGGDSVEDMFKGWNEDPYDPEYTKGIPMNLSERHGVDGMFPDHPLSQAREFVHAVITDEIISASEDEEEKEKSGERGSDGDSKSKDMSEEEMLKKLFDKDTIRNYHAQKVTVPDAPAEKKMSSDDIKETLKKGAVVAGKGIKAGAEVTGKGIKVGAAATGKGLKMAAETIQEKGKEVKEKRQEKKSQKEQMENVSDDKCNCKLRTPY